MHDAHAHKLKPPMNVQHDHVLGNADIEFYRYETFDAGYSDHLAQVATFRLRR